MKETIWKTITAIGTGVVTSLLGGWDKALEIMLIVVVMDYITGFGAAIKTKTLKSSTGFEGIMKKGSMFLIVILAAQLDRITGNGADVFRSCTAFFFIANDALSIIENVGEMGVSLPSFLKNALSKLKDKNDNPTDLDEDEGADTEQE